MNVQRDHLWKLAFRMLMQQIIKFFFPVQYEDVDWTKEIVFLDKELNTIQANSRPKNRIADVLVMLTLKTGKYVFIFLHIEVQGYFDADYSLRVHQMSYRIEDKMGAAPVMLSIFTDDDPNFHPKEYYVEVWGSSKRTAFNTYKVMNNHPSTYFDPNDPVSLMMEIIYNSTQIKKATDDEIMQSFVGLVKKLVQIGYSKEYILLMKNFIEAHIKFGDSRKYRTFEKKIDKMVKYETTADILSYWNFEKRLELLEKAAIKSRLTIERLRKKEELARKKEERERQEKERERQEKERERQEKERSEQEKKRTRERAVLGLLAQAMSKENIAIILEISLEEIEVIQEKYKDNNPLTNLLNRHSEN